MNVEIDHVFICCAEGAPEADALVRFGLTEGSPNVHPGQGTACRRFFFENAYLELFWVVDPDAARSEAIRETGLWDRWSGRDGTACPFGLILRPGSDKEEAPPPFATWSYHPPYSSDGSSIEVASSGSLTDPAFFYLASQRASPRPRQKPVPLGRLTGVAVHGPGVGRSAAAKAVEAAGVATFTEASTFALVLEFDYGAGGRTADLEPALPLTLRW